MEVDLRLADPRCMDLDNRIGDSLSTDYFLLRSEFTPAQLDYLTRTRTFVERGGAARDQRLLGARRVPLAADREAGTVGIVGDGIAGYGCPDIDPLSAGLVTMELSRGDGSMATFVGVQAGLAMRSIAMLGSEEQKQRWLPPMARLEKLGAFALTEPDHGSDSIALETTARRDGDHWVLDGAQEVDRQRQHRRRRRGVGARRRRRPGQGLPRREGHARLRRPGDRGQGVAARRLAGRDRPGRRARRRGEPAARRAVVPRHRRRAGHHPRRPARGPRSGTPSRATTPR